MIAPETCAFCDIVGRKADADIVFEDDQCLAFLDNRPLLHGHTLLVPKKHYATFLEVPKTRLAHVMQTAKRLARAMEDGLEADGSFTAINTRVSQSVPHLHIHVVPRWQDDRLFSPKRVWTRRRPYRSEDKKREVLDKLRAAMGGG